MLLLLFSIVFGCNSGVLSLEPVVGNWTFDYDASIARFALDLSAAAYAPDPTKCLVKHQLKLAMREEAACDYAWDKCWSFLAYNENWIVFAVRGTTSRWQLISEFIETMSAPKSRFPSGGSVQRYFYGVLKSLWANGIDRKMRKLKILYPNATVLFTGHSLGAAVASLASSLFAFTNQDISTANQIRLITFGQPRVGNQEYAQGHDLYVPNTWRIIHRYESIFCLNSISAYNFTVPNSLTQKKKQGHMFLHRHKPINSFHLLKQTKETISQTLTSDIKIQQRANCEIALFSHQCVSLFNHGPWHTGTEIWYNQDMTANNTYTPIFRICAGEPTNEDRTCSNSGYIHYNIQDHSTYFDKDVSTYGITGCED